MSGKICNSFLCEATTSHEQSNLEPKLPVTDKRRQILRDNKLWKREVHRATTYNLGKIHCPCTWCGGTRRSIKLSEAKKHLQKNERAPDCRVYRGPDENNSSDDEWERHWHNSFSKTNNNHSNVMDSGIDVRGVVRDMFQEVEGVLDVENHLDSITVDALSESDRTLGLHQSDELTSLKIVSVVKNRGHKIQTLALTRENSGRKNAQLDAKSTTQRQEIEERIVTVMCMRGMFPLLNKRANHVKED